MFTKLLTSWFTQQSERAQNIKTVRCVSVYSRNYYFQFFHIFKSLFPNKFIVKCLALATLRWFSDKHFTVTKIFFRYHKWRRWHCFYVNVLVEIKSFFFLKRSKEWHWWFLQKSMVIFRKWRQSRRCVSFQSVSGWFVWEYELLSFKFWCKCGIMCHFGMKCANFVFLFFSLNKNHS